MLGAGLRGEFPVRGVGERLPVGGEQPILRIVGVRGASRRTGLGEPIAVAVIDVGRQGQAIELDLRQPPRQVIRVAVGVRDALGGLGLGRDAPQVVAGVLLAEGRTAVAPPLSEPGVPGNVP